MNLDELFDGPKVTYTANCASPMCGQVYKCSRAGPMLNAGPTPTRSRPMRRLPRSPAILTNTSESKPWYVLHGLAHRAVIEGNSPMSGLKG